MAKKRKTTGWITFILFLILSLSVGTVGRFTDLAKKPMHTDEAVLAFKTQEFLETGFFKYDPKDYHGPFLHHATAWVGKMKGWELSDLDERQLRYVTAVFGMGMLLLPFLMVDVLGKIGAAFASLMLAISPMLTYFSRYYIMEIPFAFLIGLFFVSCWRWSQRRNPVWLVTGGISLGLMHATKETFVINLAAMVLAWALVRFAGMSFENHKLRYSFKSKASSTLILGVVGMVILALGVSTWMFSNGFKDWSGVADSYKTYLSYLDRAGLEGYAKPWYYYLEVLFYKRDGFVWSEGFVAILAALGLLSLLSREIPSHQKAWITFTAIYSVLLLAIYSCISYKTPWSILSIHIGFAFLAGMAVQQILKPMHHWLLRSVTNAVLLCFAGMTLGQTSRVTDYQFPGQTRYAADARNPYVYSHTSSNLMHLVHRVDLLAELMEDGDEEMSIDIIHPEHGWPLPWYFRHFDDVTFATELPDRLDAAVVVMDYQMAEAARTVVKNQHELLVEETFSSAPESTAPPLPSGIPDVGFMSADLTQPIPPLPPDPLEYARDDKALRPNVRLEVWIRKDLWERVIQEEARRAPLHLN